MYRNARKMIFKLVENNIAEFSCHKFASNVIEQLIIQGAPDEINEIVTELMGVKN